MTLRYTGANLIADIDDTHWGVDISGDRGSGTLAGEAAIHLAGEHQ